MDDLSKELQDFLIRLGKDEKSVGDKLAGYTRELVNMLYEPHTLGQLAVRYKTTPDIMEKGIEACLRKIAVSPEWQQIKPLTKLRAIKLR